jgi:uncharacterized protein
VKVVLDTNVLVSAVFFGGVPGRILAAWRDRRIRLVLSASILAEYREVGAVIESRYGGHDFEAIVALLALNSELIDAPDYLDPPVCSDADDDKFLSCAKAGGAVIVVSGDAALRAVSGWSGIDVLTPRQFADRHLSDHQ